MVGQIHERLGSILQKHGHLTAAQVSLIVAQQARLGRPFGELAQQMFGLDRGVIETAWVEQYRQYGTEIDLRTQLIDPDVMGVVTRRQAWQFLLLPLRREDDQLVLATTAGRLPRAVTFAWRRLGEPVHLLVVPQPQLEDYLQVHYPWQAMRMHEAVAVGE